MIKNNYKFPPLHYHPNCYATMDGALQRGLVDAEIPYFYENNVMFSTKGKGIMTKVRLDIIRSKLVF